MNTRLQVEHPVTEAITGHDLVEWQLRVAAGQPLPATQAQLTMRGHAIEARICAENPDANFLPATGTLHVARWPAHVSFVRSDDMPRIDRGFDEGDAISPHYDSMIAKLIVWGENRAQALARLDAALAQTHIVGLATNVAFLRRVVKTQAFATADLDTALIERERAALFEHAPLPLECAAAGVIAREVANEVGAAGQRPVEPPRRLAHVRRRDAALRSGHRRRAPRGDAAPPARRRVDAGRRRSALAVFSARARQRSPRRHARANAAGRWPSMRRANASPSSRPRARWPCRKSMRSPMPARARRPAAA